MFNVNNFILLLIVSLLISFNIFAADKEYGNVTVSEVTSIYDADTFRVNISNWPEIIGKRVPVRVLGVDAPEIRGKCEAEKIAARKAKQFTVAALRNASKIELRNIQRGKYFRILADVYMDGRNLATELINSGHGRPYKGGKREGWCH